MRPIDADALIKQIDNPQTEYSIMIQIRRALKEFINSAPTVKSKYGEWIDMGGYEVCKNCHEVKRFPHWNFCPNCGADMRGKGDNQ